MESSRSTEIKVGFTVFFGLILLVLVLAWAKNVDLTSESKVTEISFNNIAGLALGDAVTVNGLRKGYVDNIHADQNRVIVKVSLDSDTDLRTDATFSIMMLDLMGGKKIEIVPGTAPEELDYSKMQIGYFSGDISTAMVMLSSVQNDIVDVIKDVKIALQNINSKLINTDLPEDLKESVKNFKILSDKLNTLVAENRKGIKDLVENGNQMLQTTDEILKENRESIPRITKKVEDLLTESNEMISQINELIKETKSQENNLGKLAYDEDLIKNMQSAIKQLSSVTKLLLEQLENEGIKVDAHIF